MSTVHAETADGVEYRVVDGEGGRELWIDGVLHSRTRLPGTAADSSATLWDSLAVGAALPAEPPRQVLLLGLGGGAVVHALRRLVAPERIVAIELDPIVARLAHEHFAVEGPDLEVRLGDAFEYVRSDEAVSYDLVIDDVFGQAEGLPARDERLDRGWWTALAALVTRDGALVADFPDGAALVGSSLCQDVDLRWSFPEAWVLWGEEHENAVAVALRRPLDADPDERVAALEGATDGLAFERLWPSDEG